MECYAVADKLETLEVRTYAGAPCTVYGYGAEVPLYVFSLRNAQLADVDLCEMKQLAWANFRASESRSQACLDYAERSRKSQSNVSGAGIDAIKLPDSDTLAELILANNRFCQLDLCRYAAQLCLLSLTGNLLSEFDATPFKLVHSLNLVHNLLECGRLDNPEMGNLDLSGNRLKQIDVTQVPELYQLFLTHNLLSALDLHAQKGLHALHIDGNRFTFSSLPLANSPYGSYPYGQQAHIDIAVDEMGRVDLSSEALVGQGATAYRWFVGAPPGTTKTRVNARAKRSTSTKRTPSKGASPSSSAPSKTGSAPSSTSSFPHLTRCTHPVHVTTADVLRGVEVAEGVQLQGRTAAKAAPSALLNEQFPPPHALHQPRQCDDRRRHPRRGSGRRRAAPGPHGCEGRPLRVEAEAGQQLSVYTAGGQQVGSVQR